MSNTAGFEALDEMIARVRRVPELVREAAPEVAQEVERELAANIAAGRAPDGSAWEPTKEGKQPLVGAAKALSVRAVGSVILMTVGGPEAKHHKGTARGKVKRRIILTRGIPAPMASAIRKVFGRRFSKLMGSGR